MSPADDARQDLKRDSPIKVRPAFHDVPRRRQGSTHEAMPDHARDECFLLLGQRQELRRKRERQVAVEGDIARDRGGVEDREQQQRVFRWFSVPALGQMLESAKAFAAIRLPNGRVWVR